MMCITAIICAICNDTSLDSYIQWVDRKMFLPQLVWIKQCLILKYFSAVQCTGNSEFFKNGW